MKTRLIIFLSTLLTGAQALAIEKPEYDVLFKDGNIEYRLYKPYTVAESAVTTGSDRNQAANEGFMRLFKYITGANTQRADIAMTAPVQQIPKGQDIAMTAPVQQVSSGRGWTISFMLPSQYTLEDAPVPTDERIFLREIPSRLMAVIRYSGRWTDKNVEKYEAVLLERLNADGVIPLGLAETAAYNAPFTPPFLRRNEIMFEVDSAPNNYRVGES